MKKGLMLLLIAVLVIGVLVTGFAANREKDAKLTLEERIKKLEAELAILKLDLKKAEGLQPDIIKDDPVKKAGPYAFTDGARGWQEDGVGMWTAMNYNVGINTMLPPAYDLDINGDVCFRAGVYDNNFSSGLTRQVLVADGAGGVQWGGSPAGDSGDYIWNQDTAAQDISGTGNPAYFWIGGWGEADAGLYGLVNGDLYVGVYGKNFSAIGTGIAGSGNNLDPVVLTNGSGLSGHSSNVGIFGKGDATAESWGVYGKSDAADGAGVVGIATTAGGGQWMLNSGVSGSSDGVGVYGYGAATAGSNGMWAASDAAADGRGIMAVGNALTPWTFGVGGGIEATGNDLGVVGFGDADASIGTYGYGLGLGSIGVLGRADVADGIGTFCVSGGAAWVGQPAGDDAGLCANGIQWGVFGVGQNVGSKGVGIIGLGGNETSFSYATGAGGSFTGAWGLLGRGVSGPGGYFTVDDPAGQWTVYLPDGNGSNTYDGVADGWYAWAKDGNSGEKIALPTIISTQHAVYASGRSTLRSGEALVEFSSDFNGTVSEGAPIIVTVTPIGECKGLYIQNSSRDGFTVKEQGEGKSSVEFNWIAVGIREGMEEFVVARTKVAAPMSAETSTETVRKQATKEITKAAPIKDTEIKEIEPLKKADLSKEEKISN